MAEELRVEVVQQFTDTTPDLTTPVLRTILIGDHFQVEENLTLGTYAGLAVTPSYPDLLVGSVVTIADVTVDIVDVNGTFALTPTTEFTAGATTVSVVITGAVGSGIMRRDITRVSSSSGVSTSGVVAPGTANFVDSSVNFITSGVVASDQLDILAPSPNVGTYFVSIIDANSLELFDDIALTTKSTLSADATDEPYTIVNDHALTGTLLIDYDARRNDLVGQLRLINRQQEIDAVAGPADTKNPLGLAANIFNVAAPGVSFFVTALADATLGSHQTVLDLIEDEDVYCLVPLVQNDEAFDVATTYEQHVTTASLPANGRFRIALVSKDVPAVLVRIASKSHPVANGTVNVGAGANEIDLDDSLGDFLANGVEPGDLVTITGSDIPDQNDTFVVKTVSATTLVLVGITAGPNTITITYEVNSPSLTTTEQAQFMSDYAESIGNRRVTNLVAGRGEIQTSFTSTTFVDSFYANASVAGLISFLPPQQGLSRITVPAITEIRQPSAGKFKREDLNLMGSGGNFIIEKPTEGSLVRVRRQRTTSTVSLEEAELSITKDVDFVSFYLVGALEPYLGQFNIVDSFFSIAQATLDTVRFNLTSGSLPGIGPILTKFEVISFAPSAAVQGVVELVVDVTPPFPVNTIRVTLIV